MSELITSYDQVREDFRKAHKRLFGKDIDELVEGKINFDGSYEDVLHNLSHKILGIQGTSSGFVRYKGKNTRIRVKPGEKDRVLEVLVHETAHFYNSLNIPHVSRPKYVFGLLKTYFTSKSSEEVKDRILTEETRGIFTRETIAYTMSYLGDMKCYSVGLEGMCKHMKKEELEEVMNTFLDDEKLAKKIQEVETQHPEITGLMGINTASLFWAYETARTFSFNLFNVAYRRDPVTLWNRLEKVQNVTQLSKIAQDAFKISDEERQRRKKFIEELETKKAEE